MNDAKNTEKQPSKLDKRKMFKDALAADKEVEAARKAVDAAIAKRSTLVQAIAETIGTGPFELDGERIEVRCRKERQRNSAGDVMYGSDKKPLLTGKETWFFVNKGDEELEKID